MKTLFKIGLLCGMVAFSGAAFAEGKLKLKTVVQKEQRVTTADGETVVEFVPVESIVPGDEVVYTVTYTNISDTTTDNVVITNPIPPQLTYIEGSAFGPGTEVTFSVDGGSNYDNAESLVVVADDVERTAKVDDFTNIRWVLKDSLAAGNQGFARFRARLN